MVENTDVSMSMTLGECPKATPPLLCNLPFRGSGECFGSPSLLFRSDVRLRSILIDNLGHHPPNLIPPSPNHQHPRKSYPPPQPPHLTIFRIDLPPRCSGVSSFNFFSTSHGRAPSSTPARSHHNYLNHVFTVLKEDLKRKYPSPQTTTEEKRDSPDKIKLRMKDFWRCCQ